MAQAIQLSPFAQRYMEELKSLVNTDRRTISFLRNLAEENQQAEKLHIVVALQQYLYYHCPAPQQLPLLYLVDCILKTVTQHYLPLLCPPLPSMFMFVWRSSPQLHAQLTKLANTWCTYLPAQTQAQIDQVIASTPSTSAPAHVATARATPPHAGSTTQGWQVQAAAPSVNMLQPTLNAAQAMHAPAAAQLLLLAQSGDGMQLLQQGVYAAAPQAHGSAAPVYAAAPYAAPQLQQQQALQCAQAVPMQAAVVASATSTSGPPVSSEDIMASLQKLFGASSGARGSDGGAGAAGAGSAAPAAAAQHAGKVLNSRSFSVIKEHDQSAIDALLSAGSMTRKGFLDARFLRTRRIRAAQQAGQPLSQRWYYSVDQWLLGSGNTETDSTGAGEQCRVPEDEEAVDNADAAAESLVEEDPSQPECAISGEPFDREYDPDTDKWYYQGAVVLTGEAATRHGVMDGSIVKVHCLAGEPTKLGMAAMGMAQRPQKSSKPVAGAGQATSAGAAARGAAKATASEASTSSGGTPQAAGAKAAPVGLLAPGSVAALLQAGHVTAAAPPEGCAAAALRVEQSGDVPGKRHPVEDLAGLGDIAQLAKKIKMEPS